jgi:hypothetical protein
VREFTATLGLRDRVRRGREPAALLAVDAQRHISSFQKKLQFMDFFDYELMVWDV